MEFLHTGFKAPPYQWISLICRLRIYHCSQAEFDAMSPLKIMQDLMMLGAESSVRKVKGGSSGSGGKGFTRRGMDALRSMVGR